MFVRSATSSATPSSRHEIVFIDGKLPDTGALLAAVKPGTRIVLLDAAQDGLLQIAQALAGVEGIDAIHILSHGSAGALELGSAHLTLGNLGAYGDALGAIRAALSDDADLLLYGCELAQGDAGRSFIEALAAATGADVAASTNLTGSALLGGDWTLESTAGQVETASLGSGAALAVYGSVLGLMPSGTTIDFSAADGASLGTVVTDGQYGSTDIAGLVIDLYQGDSSGNATGQSLTFSVDLDGVASDGGGDPTMVIKERDGKEFAFKGIKLDDYLMEQHVIQFEGFKDGVSTGTVTVAMMNEVLVVTEADLPSSKFGNVDKVVFKAVSGIGGNGNMWMTYNDIVIDTSSAAPGDTTAPTVASIVRNAAAATNADSLTWTVTFSESVTNIGQGDFSVSGTTATVTSVTGSGTTYQVTVSGGDLDNLNGNVTLGFAGGQDIADGAGNALVNTTPTGANQPAYTLDNTAPTLVSATVDGATLVLTYSEALDGASTPDIGAFTVGLGNGGTPATIDSVVVDGANKTVTLTLGAAVQAGQAVSVAYNDPHNGGSGNPIQDAVGNDAQSLGTTNVTNNTVSTNHAPTIGHYFSTSVATGMASALPDYLVADQDGDNLTVTLTATNGTINGLVDADNNPANGIQLSGSAAVINAMIEDATFTATANGTASVTISVTDGKVGSPVTATSYLAATSPEQAITDGVVTGAVMASPDRTALVAGADGNMYMAMLESGGSGVSIYKWNGDAWSTTATTLSAADLGYAQISAGVTLGVDQYGKIYALAVATGAGVSAVSLAVYDPTSATPAWHVDAIESGPSSAQISVSGASIVVTANNAVNIAYHRSADQSFSGGTEKNVLITNGSGALVVVDSEVGDPSVKTLQQFGAVGNNHYVLKTDLANGQLLVDHYVEDAYQASTYIPTTAPVVGAAASDGGVPVVITGGGSEPLLTWIPIGNSWISVPVVANADPAHSYIAYSEIDSVTASGRSGLIKGLDGKLYLANYETDSQNNFLGNKLLRLESGGWVDGRADLSNFNLFEGLSFAVDASGNVMIVDTASTGTDFAWVFGHNSDFEAVAAPAFQSAAVDGGTLTMTYDKALDGAHLPDAGAFVVRVDNAVVNVTGVAIGADGKSVVLTLATPALQGQAVTVAYTDPTGGNDASAIQDTAGNDAATLPVTAPTEQTAPFQGVGALFTFDTAGGAGAGTLAGVGNTTAHGTYDHNASQVRLNIETSGSRVEDFAHFTGGDTSQLASRNGLLVGFSDPETSVRYSLSDFGATTGSYGFDLTSLRLYNDRAQTQIFRITASNGQFQDIVLDAAAPNAYLTKAYALDAAKFSGITWFTITALTDMDAGLAGNQSVYIIDNIVMDNITALDLTPPALVSAAVNGTSLVLSYDEALDTQNAPLTGDFVVKVDGQTVTVTSLSIDPVTHAVKLVLANAVQPNQVVTVSYADSTSGVNAIQDGAGNDAAGLTNQTVTNNSLDTLAPTLVSAAVNGTSLVLTYNEALDNVALMAGSFTVNVGGMPVGITNVALDAATGKVTLTLATAVEPNDSVTVSYADVSGGYTPIQDTAGNDAANLNNQAVTNNSLDTLAPTLSSATVSGTSLVLTYDEALDITQQVAAGAFTVKVGNNTVTVTGAVVNNDKTVTLTLATAVQPGDVVKVSYQAPSSGGVVQDAAGNDAAGVTDATVTNNSLDTLAPTLASAVVNGTSLVLTYNEALDITQQVGAGAFTVKVGNNTVTVTGVVVNNDKTVTLTLATAVQPNDTVKVSYQAPSSGGVVQDAAGNDAAGVTDATVTNNSLDTLAPAFVSAAVNGRTLVMTYNEALDAIHGPAASNFLVKVGNATVAVSAVVVDSASKTVTLTLASSVQNGQPVTVSYTGPGAGSDHHPIQDAAGNDAASLVNQTVTNNTPAPTPPSPPSPPAPTESTVDGVRVVSQQVSNADGTTSTKVTVPVVTASRNEQVGNNTVADIPLAQNASGGNILLAQLPVGYGMTSIGSGIKTAGDSLTDLIREIKAHTATGSADQNQLTGGGSGFLGDLASSTKLLVQTIVPTYSGNTAPDQPLAIVGQASAPGNPLTAIVLDASGLPAGTHIKLDNVEFAALIGAVNVSGGAGSQKVWGDSASQTIFLGEDDDVLHGGGGDDIVGSAGGNDQIFGDEGNDIVFGGQGDDYIDGGTGTDTLRLMGASRAEYTMRIKDGAVVMTHLVPNADGTDIVANVELLQYAGQTGTVDFNDSEIAGLVRLYSTAFGRNADTGGINFWIGKAEQGMSMMQLAHFFVASSEGKADFGALSNRDFVNKLYDVAMHRVASSGEVDFWTNHLDRGALDRGDVLYYFATSEEKAELVGVVTTSIVTS